MEATYSSINPINVEVVIRPGCNFSYRTLKSLLQCKKVFPSMDVKVLDIAASGKNRQTLGGITPSIWVNGELWFLGSFSVDKFHNRLSAIL
ncbi:MAG: hypothetical protein HQ508_02120 [Candidatus Marinimicrobia bacterium]|nr:hypothetical protein [Candidatus Neomarinimicrobiota bacterium]